MENIDVPLILLAKAVPRAQKSNSHYYSRQINRGRTDGKENKVIWRLPDSPSEVDLRARTSLHEVAEL